MKLGTDQEKGSVLGSTLLIAGSCIGAGMLGLPVSTALGGFKPALILFAASWIFMMVTGLLMLEVNLYFKKDVNLITMADSTLGNGGKIASWFLFLFLFYSIMVAYTAGSGELVADFIEELSDVSLSNAMGSLIFVVFFGVTVYFGTFAVDHLNRLLMFGLIVSYCLLVKLGFPHVSKKLLEHVNWIDSLWGLPVMIISFGYHNLVPSLTTYLDFNLKRMRISIIIGSAVPLAIYLLWEWLILGLIPLDNFQNALYQGNMVTHTLKEVVGESWVLAVAEFFAFFAIVTSFLGVALSFVDFLSDGLNIKKDRMGKLLLCVLVLVPPLIFALLYPTIFVVALKYAGGFGAVILFGVLPALMVWSGRYRKKLWTEVTLPGGKLLLSVVILFGLAIFVLQLVNALYIDR